MAQRLSTFDAARDRNDLRRAAQRLDLFWPNRSVRIDVFKRFASSIRIANGTSAAAWSVTLHAKSIRLNVGQTEVLTASHDKIDVLVKTAGRERYYAAVKVGSRKITFVPNKLSAVSHAQWNTHAAYIQAAASAKSSTPFASSFSESLLNVIEDTLGERLPRPTHQHRPLHILQGGVDNGDKVWLERAARLGLKRRTWVAPKSVQDGDDAIIFVPGLGFFATARIDGKAKPRADWQNRYGAPIAQVKLIAPPIPLADIRRLLPDLTWALYPRSIHTVSLEVASKIRNLLVVGQDFSDTEINALEQDKSLSLSERETLILARRGQGQYRKQLVELWTGCSVTGAGPAEILRASHIKPWSACVSNHERVDKFNGLLLLPNLDALFDRALITFNEKGKIKLSRRLDRRYWARLGVSPTMKIGLRPQHAKYFTHHRERFEKGER